MICVVGDCAKPMLARGYCSKHYNRWRNHGDPLTMTIAGRGEPLAWLKDRVERLSPDCMIWPFKSHYAKGYGSLVFEGKLTGAHRVMCQLAHGPAPTGRHEAAHSCGVRNCVNPSHLRWATAAENNADKRHHGTVNNGELNPSAKLKATDVRRIRQRANIGETHGLIAADFGVCRETISMIARGATWKHIEGVA